MSETITTTKRSKGGLITAGVLTASGIIYLFSGTKVDPAVKNYSILMWWTAAATIFVRSFFPPLDWKSGFVTVLGGFGIATTIMVMFTVKDTGVALANAVFTCLFLYAGFRYPKRSKK
jgi:hypothetical protein